jgi:outer membrane protein OmpA-like peptidoglycan-associated protein
LRKPLGILVFVLGVVVLCWYAAGINGLEMQHIVTQGASAAAENVQTRVSGRDIEVSGVAADEAERDSVLAALDAVEGRRVVRSNIEILPVASPYVFSAEKTADGVSASGFAPTDAESQELAKSVNKADLKLASGAPNSWSSVAMTGLSALEALESGRLDLSDQKITLSGVAKTPAEGRIALSRFADLPDGYTLDTSLEYLEKGDPKFSLQYSASDGAVLDGTLPAGLDRQAVASALNINDMTGNAEAGTWGDPERAQRVLDRLAEWMPQIETLSLVSGEDGLKLEVESFPGADIDLFEKQMKEVFGDDVAISVSAAGNLPPEGTSRVNAATGETEVLTNGYWLPQLDFTAEFETCQDFANTLLQQRQVNFVTASAQLDSRSLRIINAISALVKKCVESGALKVEVAGHTDSQGDADFNQILSSDRARSVVQALLRRGVPEAAISAAGYGETRPVADNDTEEGRAANRRVVLIFSKMPAEQAN